MMAAIGSRTSGRWLATLVLVVALGSAAPALAQDPPAHDLLNAVLWMQRSFESAPFVHDFKLSVGERRKAKRGVLDAWPGP